MPEKLTFKLVAAKLPKRPKDANKGTFGRVLVVAGSQNFPGAAYLACTAGYRVGAGLVTLATTDKVKVIVSRKLPEVTFVNFNEIFKKIKQYKVLLVGPGLGQNSQMEKIVKKIINTNLKSMVIDGDGLNIIARLGKWEGQIKSDTILTPHPGEMAKLTGLSVDKIQADRQGIAKYYAIKWRQTVVLKGANTVIVSPQGKIAISTFANPALATAGTGDVLSGMIAGFMAQGLTSFNAACVGVYIHGLAGKQLRKKIGDSGLLASDLLLVLPQVIKRLNQQIRT